MPAPRVSKEDDGAQTLITVTLTTGKSCHMTCQLSGAAHTVNTIELTALLSLTKEGQFFQDLPP